MVEDKRNIYQRLAAIRAEIGPMVKNENNQQQNFKYVGSPQVLAAMRDAMDRHGVLLVPSIAGHEIGEKTTSSGGIQLVTHIDLLYAFVNINDPTDRVECSWYAQGIDSAEKGPGKAATYAEKYFLLKFFNVPTPKDDPDGDPKPEDASGYRQRSDGQRRTNSTEPASQAQRGKIWAEAGDLWPQRNEEEKRSLLAIECRALGIPDSTKDMTKADASKLIEELMKKRGK